MDVELVNDHIMALIDGKEINAPVYNMKTGYRDPPGHRFAIPDGGPINRVENKVNQLEQMHTELSTKLA